MHCDFPTPQRAILVQLCWPIREITRVTKLLRFSRKPGVWNMVVTSISSPARPWREQPWRLNWVGPEPSPILPPIARCRALWIGQSHWLLLVAAMMLAAFLGLGALAAYRIESALPALSEHFQSALGLFFWSAVGWWVIGTYFYWGWRLRRELLLLSGSRTRPRR